MSNRAILQENNAALAEILRDLKKLSGDTIQAPADGKTHIHVSIRERRDIAVCLYVEGEVVVNYGDGSPVETLIGSGLTAGQIHTYQPGEYDITLRIMVGEAWIAGNSNGCQLIIDPSGTTGSNGYPTCITQVQLSNDMEFDDHAFEGCTSLEAVYIPDSIGFISDYAFCGCSSLSDVRFSNALWAIGGYAFRHCVSLQEVILSDIGEVGTAAFEGCAALTYCYLASDVYDIQSSAFGDCPHLRMVVVDADSPPFIGEDVFEHTPSDLMIVVPRGRYNDYAEATNWSEYADHLSTRIPISEIIAYNSEVINAPEYIYCGNHAGTLNDITVQAELGRVFDYAYDADWFTNIAVKSSNPDTGIDVLSVELYEPNAGDLYIYINYM